jgi:hypothetical protein
LTRKSQRQHGRYLNANVRVAVAAQLNLRMVSDVKIVETDNYGGDYPNEVLIADNIQSCEHARIMQDSLNDKLSSDKGPRFYKIEPDDYVLDTGGPD